MKIGSFKSICCILFFQCSVNAYAEPAVPGLHNTVDGPVPKTEFLGNFSDPKTCGCYGHHPLAPLTAAETELAARIVRSWKPTLDLAYNTITLKEPPKHVLLEYFLKGKNPPTDLTPRRAYLIVNERGSAESIGAIVNLHTRLLESWTPFSVDQQPMFTNDENSRAMEEVLKDPEVLRRLRNLGFKDTSNIFPSLWSVGYVGDKPQWQGKRLGQILFFAKSFTDDNPYAHPFPFLAIFDFAIDAVIDVLNFPTHHDTDTENGDGVFVPTQNFNYDQDLRPPGFLRRDIKPIIISSPRGPSFTVHGRQIEWQKFKILVGFNQREGLVLHHVTYKDGHKIRPLLYRAAISEMVVPYGDPRKPYHLKSVFDEGEFGLGLSTTGLTAGEDCIGSVYFFDTVTNDVDGKAVTLKNGICVYEEDAGVLWKHHDEVTEKIHIARSRRLSIHFTARLGNYEYLFYWHFYQDASIQFEVKLSGVLITTMLAVGSDPPSPINGYLLSPRLIAPFHQHIFAARLDTDIDGVKNDIEMIDIEAEETPTGSLQNPYGIGIVAKHTLLKTQAEGRTKTCSASSRSWRISNPFCKDENTGVSPGWVLRPANTQRILMKPDSPMRPRAGFTDYDLWVTRYNEDQMYAAGEFINLDGLPKWVAEDPEACIYNTDIVLWHTFGLTHYPRIEDWPLMSTEPTGFWLKPVNFFKENPALDVPNSHKS